MNIYDKELCNFPPMMNFFIIFLHIKPQNNMKRNWFHIKFRYENETQRGEVMCLLSFISPFMPDTLLGGKDSVITEKIIAFKEFIILGGREDK